ncbi:MAG: L-serine ammonia-lyase, iron-sulfur-dependent, subunit alpha [Clostridiales bacterium]|jgi:L-serine dehydratase|nr:L-serine ammonia-lyase, iron-sulfur-dependent, subunit alpha [Bacillota bacterium]NLL54304.1 L-serine ammonia-lyase, iron-sulfur-dependent, subunit alpha [Clostridiales bacterium]
MIDYTSLEALAEAALQGGVSIGELVLQDQAGQMEKRPEDLMEQMDGRLAVMEHSARAGSAPDIRSTSGLTGGDAFRMGAYAAKGGALSGDFCARAMATALAVAECNASMGRIVASPTAGSCGILPGALLTMMDMRGASREKTCLGLMTAGGVGLVLALQATISGAEGGCQAECGSAAAMAAAALVEMAGGNPDMAVQAAAMAIKNSMGLVCDPVAGLVEVPCIKRNAGAVMCAVAAADMALAGIRSVIPADEVIAAMREVGESLPCALRETAQGGLAATPTAQALAATLFEGTGGEGR